MLGSQPDTVAEWRGSRLQSAYTAVRIRPVSLFAPNPGRVFGVPVGGWRSRGQTATGEGGESGWPGGANGRRTPQCVPPLKVGCSAVAMRRKDTPLLRGRATGVFCLRSLVRDLTSDGPHPGVWRPVRSRAAPREQREPREEPRGSTAAAHAPKPPSPAPFLAGRQAEPFVGPQRDPLRRPPHAAGRPQPLAAGKSSSEIPPSTRAAKPYPRRRRTLAASALRGPVAHATASGWSRGNET